MNASEVWSRWQALVFCIGLICTDSSRYCQLKIVMRSGSNDSWWNWTHEALERQYGVCCSRCLELFAIWKILCKIVVALWAFMYFNSTPCVL
jgi:hypothetical protein